MGVMFFAFCFFVWFLFTFLATKYNRDPAYKKPAVPLKDEKPIMNLVSDKNFIVANAVENILAGKFCFLCFFILEFCGVFLAFLCIFKPFFEFVWIWNLNF